MKKRLLTLLLALALAVSLALPAAATQTPVEVSSALELAQAMAAPVPARGRFRSRAAAAEPTRVVAFAPALADGYGADRVLHLAAWQEYVLEFSDAAAAQRALARLRSDPDVTDCFLDEAVTADDTLAGLWDETASRSWGGHEMGLTTLRHQADVLLPAGRRATVAVIDTGAEVSHPLLAGRVSARSYDFADNTADVTDVNGHGTATAGLVADLTPDEVDVMVLRVYGDDNLSKPSRVLTALEYALENGATVVNMSIGWPNAIEKGYSFLNNVLAQAYAAGVVVVAAAGNLSQSNPTANADDVYPANQAQVLTVSAVDRSRTFDDTYSASGASVDLCAPGTGVAVAALSGGMTVRSGTSFAAPHVAAAAACVQLTQPGATAARVRRTLCDYAEDLGAPGRDDQYGNGFPVLTQCFHDRLCPGRRFADMPDADAWSHAGLDYCIAAGLIHGMTPVTVAPQALATRAQVMQLLWTAAGSPKTTGPLPFTDVAPGAWYYDAVHWAYRTGLVSGTSPTTFTPDAAITRQDFTVILYAQAGRPAMIGTALAAFPDAGQVAGYAYAALTWAVEQGLIGGVGTPSGPQLAPRGYATRAQVAKRFSWATMTNKNDSKTRPRFRSGNGGGFAIISGPQPLQRATGAAGLVCPRLFLRRRLLGHFDLDVLRLDDLGVDGVQIRRGAVLLSGGAQLVHLRLQLGDARVGVRHLLAELGEEGVGRVAVVFVVQAADLGVRALDALELGVAVHGHARHARGVLGAVAHGVGSAGDLVAHLVADDLVGGIGHGLTGLAGRVDDLVLQAVEHVMIIFHG